MRKTKLQNLFELKSKERFAQRLITAPDTKGQKEAEKGLKGNLSCAEKS